MVRLRGRKVHHISHSQVELQEYPQVQPRRRITVQQPELLPPPAPQAEQPELTVHVAEATRYESSPADEAERYADAVMEALQKNQTPPHFRGLKPADTVRGFVTLFLRREGNRISSGDGISIDALQGAIVGRKAGERMFAALRRFVRAAGVTREDLGSGLKALLPSYNKGPQMPKKTSELRWAISKLAEAALKDGEDAPTEDALWLFNDFFKLGFDAMKRHRAKNPDAPEVERYRYWQRMMSPLLLRPKRELDSAALQTFFGRAVIEGAHHAGGVHTTIDLKDPQDEGNHLQLTLPYGTLNTERYRSNTILRAKLVVNGLTHELVVGPQLSSAVMRLLVDAAGRSKDLETYFLDDLAMAMDQLSGWYSEAEHPSSDPMAFAKAVCGGTHFDIEPEFSGSSVADRTISFESKHGSMTVRFPEHGPVEVRFGGQGVQVTSAEAIDELKAMVIHKIADRRSLLDADELVSAIEAVMQLAQAAQKARQLESSLMTVQRGARSSR